MSDCIFCGIVRGEVRSARVAESATALAFRDTAPKAPVHILVIPKTHYASLITVPDGRVLGDMVELALEVARSEGIVETGFRTVINTGADGGQTVGHLHLHLLGGRPLEWPPG